MLQHQKSTGKPSDAHGAWTFKLPSLKAERGNEFRPNGCILRTLEGRNQPPLSKRQIITDSSGSERLKKTGARQGSCAAPPQQKSSTSVQLTPSFSGCPFKLQTALGRWTYLAVLTMETPVRLVAWWQDDCGPVFVPVLRLDFSLNFNIIIIFPLIYLVFLKTICGSADWLPPQFW